MPNFEQLQDKPKLKDNEEAVVSCTDLFSTFFCFRPSIDKLFIKPTDCHPLTSTHVPPGTSYLVVCWV